MTTAPHRRRALFAIAVGAAVSPLLLGLGTAPAFADEPAPPPACSPAVPHVPVMNPCGDPPLIFLPPAVPPHQQVPPDDYWNDPNVLIPEQAIDNNLNQLMPDEFVIGDVYPEGAGPLPIPWPEDGH